MNPSRAYAASRCSSGGDPSGLRSGLTTRLPRRHGQFSGNPHQLSRRGGAVDLGLHGMDAARVVADIASDRAVAMG